MRVSRPAGASSILLAFWVGWGATSPEGNAAFLKVTLKPKLKCFFSEQDITPETEQNYHEAAIKVTRNGAKSPDPKRVITAIYMTSSSMWVARSLGTRCPNKRHNHVRNAIAFFYVIFKVAMCSLGTFTFHLHPDIITNIRPLSIADSI